jgi:hypothetical protein
MHFILPWIDSYGNEVFEDTSSCCILAKEFSNVSSSFNFSILPVIYMYVRWVSIIDSSPASAWKQNGKNDE